MAKRLLPIAGIVWLTVAACAMAQFKDVDPEGAKMGKSQTSQWRMGLTLKASGGACRGGFGYMSVPMDWPEQQVNVVSEDVSPEVKLHYAQIESGVKVMNFKIGQVSPGQEVKGLVTFEIRRTAVLPPEDTDSFVAPDVKKLPRDVKQYLLPSPKIESRDPKIRDLAKKIGVDKDKAWDHVEAIFDWVRKTIKYQNGPLKGALAALRDKTGDCEEMTSLFIAICRAADVPARTVWVPGHCYPEFYLEDAKGKGHWFPCQIAGAAREFGGSTDLRPIWQKGDNIRPPVNTREHRRYLDFDLTISGNSRPEVRSVRESAAR
jgi:hypothetical protein